MADRMVERNQIELFADGGALTDGGIIFMRDLGVDLGLPALDTASSSIAAASNPKPRGKARVFCRSCLDWSERRPNIGGALGKALCPCFFSRGWGGSGANRDRKSVV